MLPVFVWSEGERCIASAFDPFKKPMRERSDDARPKLPQRQCNGAPELTDVAEVDKCPSTTGMIRVRCIAMYGFVFESTFVEDRYQAILIQSRYIRPLSKVSANTHKMSTNVVSHDCLGVFIAR